MKRPSEESATGGIYLVVLDQKGTRDIITVIDELEEMSLRAAQMGFYFRVNGMERFPPK